jgi:glycerol uptake facilitator protein
MAGPFPGDPGLKRRSGVYRTAIIIFDAGGDRLLIGWDGGFAVVFALYVAGGISGAHVNPAVLLALALRRGSRGRRCRPTGSLYLNYRYAISSYEHGHTSSGGS